MFNAWAFNIREGSPILGASELRYFYSKSVTVLVLVNFCVWTYKALMLQRKNKYFDAKLKALKARNEYVLCLESANATIHKYFVDDISDLIDCMDFGFHQCIKRSLYMHTTAEEGRMKSLQSENDTLYGIINGMDSRHDKQRFLEFNHSAFMVPKKFEFQGQKDEVRIFSSCTYNFRWADFLIFSEVYGLWKITASLFFPARPQPREMSNQYTNCPHLASKEI